MGDHEKSLNLDLSPNFSLTEPARPSSARDTSIRPTDAFASPGLRRPEVWVVTAMDPNSLAGVTIPYTNRTGIIAGAMSSPDKQSWYSGIYYSQSRGGVNVGILGGRMVDVIDGIGRDNDRFILGFMMGTSDHTGNGLEVKCIQSTKKGEPGPTCGVGYKFKI